VLIMEGDWGEPLSPQPPSRHGTPPLNKGRTPQHHAVDLGLRKEVIIKFVNAVKSNQMGGTSLAFFEKYDKKKEGVLSVTVFAKLLRGHLKLKTTVATDAEVGRLVELICLEEPEGGLKLATLASVVDMGGSGFVRLCQRRLGEIAVKQAGVKYDPYLEFAPLREQNAREVTCL